MGTSRFAYVQARLQARHGLRPLESTWRRLDASYSLEHYLQATRHTSLRPWVVRLPGKPDVHSIERTLREDWIRYIHSIAAWQPRPWQAAVSWITLLVNLPAFAHLVQGLPAPPWMQDDVELHPVSRADARSRFEAMHGSEFAPLLSVSNRELDSWEGWRAHWHTLLPSTGKRIRTGLKRLERAIEEHLLEVEQRGKEDPDQPQNLLSAELVRLFRAYAQTPVAVFSHLGIVALDLERLRAALVLRALFRAGNRDAS